VGIARRVAELYEVKVSGLLDRAEDPREMLDYSYRRQQDLLREMRQAAVNLVASRNRADLQEAELRRSAERLRTQAEQAVAAGKDELARQALRLRAETIVHADDLATEQVHLRAEQDRLAEATRRLEARLQVLAYQKEALKAAYTAAEARAAAEAADLFDGAREAADAERRTAEQTAGLQARAEALSGQAEDRQQPVPPSLAADRIQEQLDAISREAAIEEELARMKEQVGSAAGKRQSGAAAGASDS
jgi:phage shock protein A